MTDEQCVALMAARFVKPLPQGASMQPAIDDAVELLVMAREALATLAKEEVPALPLTDADATLHDPDG